jgi:hypothetical protein
MSRGGFGAGRRGELKGASWEYDPSIRLENKPLGNYPACILKLMGGQNFNRIVGAPQFKKTSTS